jgi:hypothetical protein
VVWCGEVKCFSSSSLPLLFLFSSSSHPLLILFSFYSFYYSLRQACDSGERDASVFRYLGHDLDHLRIRAYRVHLLVALDELQPQPVAPSRVGARSRRPTQNALLRAKSNLPNAQRYGADSLGQ